MKWFGDGCDDVTIRICFDAVVVATGSVACLRPPSVITVRCLYTLLPVGFCGHEAISRIYLRVEHLASETLRCNQVLLIDALCSCTITWIDLSTAGRRPRRVYSLILVGSRGLAQCESLIEEGGVRLRVSDCLGIMKALILPLIHRILTLACSKLFIVGQVCLVKGQMPIVH